MSTDEITDEQIEQLKTEAGEAGDMEMCRICTLALDGEVSSEELSLCSPEWQARLQTMSQSEARTECQRVIRDAAAMVD